MQQPKDHGVAGRVHLDPQAMVSVGPITFVYYVYTVGRQQETCHEIGIVVV